MCFSTRRATSSSSTSAPRTAGRSRRRCSRARRRTWRLRWRSATAMTASRRMCGASACCCATCSARSPSTAATWRRSGTTSSTSGRGCRAPRRPPSHSCRSCCTRTPRSASPLRRCSGTLGSARRLPPRRQRRVRTDSRRRWQSTRRSRRRCFVTAPTSTRSTGWQRSRSMPSIRATTSPPAFPAGHVRRRARERKARWHSSR
mmetsp:Transcript_4549/g.11086  ORF Transcript_4549/g.11086 Transcript_4549/m.11086 type:complete len:203 (-) Transcript_4549:662-1270(-)